MPAKMLAIGISICLPLNAQANIESEMQSMFENMGASANYTQAGAWHNQNMTMYSGGALSVRTPSSNLNAINLQPPSIEAGCGGIDFFGGSFSFVNKEQFVQFTRNLGNNAAGVAFEIALDSLDPLIGGAISKIRSLADLMNKHNLNSCAAAKQLAGGVMGAIGEGLQSQCKATAVANGQASDGADAAQSCGFADKLVAAADKAREKQSPTNTITFVGGNLMREAITMYYGVNADNIKEFDINFLMSLTGTLVVRPPKKDADNGIQLDATYHEPTIKNVQELIYGLNNKTSSPPSESAKITVNLLVCRQGSQNLWDECESKETQIPSLSYQFKEILEKLVISIRNETPLSEEDKLNAIALIENTNVPILKMAINDAMLGTTLLSTYRNVIVTEYMANYLMKVERNTSAALGRYKKTDSAMENDVAKMYENLRELRRTIMAERADAYKKASAEDTIVAYLQNFENHWRGSFPGVAKAVKFDIQNSVRG